MIRAFKTIWLYSVDALEFNLKGLIRGNATLAILLIATRLDDNLDLYTIQIMPLLSLTASYKWHHLHLIKDMQEKMTSHQVRNSDQFLKW
jgi:hypothetical protein